MTQLASLPTLSVQIAFNPTNVISPTQTWTDVTAYVRDFTTKSGKQHYLDRVEASTVQLTVNNRNGFFLNGTTNGTGFVVSVRLPIKITATWSGTTYPVFYGLIDSIEEKIGDELNTDLVIQASDFIKYLSLSVLSDINFWQTNAITTPGDILRWYEFNQIPFTITGANVVANYPSGNGSKITYACNNNFATGQTVIVCGLTSPTGYDTVNGVYTVLSATASTFTVESSWTTSETFTIAGASGTAAIGSIPDLLGSSNSGSYVYASPASFPVVGYLNNGALIYSTSTAVDLTGGTGVSSAGFSFVPGTGSGGWEFWFLGTNLYGQVLVSGNVTGTPQALITISASGTIGTSGNVSDGYWHHIAVNNVSGHVLVDGAVVGTLGSGFVGYTTLTTQIGQSNLGVSGSPTYANCYIDQVLVYNSSVTDTNIKNRYLAGSILQVANQSSADRIAQTLVLAGFGSISGGAYVVSDYYVGNSYQTYSAWTPGFSTGVLTEPYYWDSPVTTSTALDLILQITDTDIGLFYQRPDSTFAFLDQNYFGTWTFTTSSSSVTIGTGSKTFTVASGLSFTTGAGVLITGIGTQMQGTVSSYSGTSLVVSVTSTFGSGTQDIWNIGSWHPNYTSPSGNYVWTDNGTGVAYYGPTTQILRDDADIWTTVQVTPQAGTQQVFNNLAAEPRYGFSTLTKSATVPTSLQSALSSAYYLGYLYQAPIPRVGGVELRSETSNGASLPAILGTNMYDAVNFQRQSPGASTAGSVNSNMIVESISHDFQADPGQWHTTFILDPYPVRS